MATSGKILYYPPSGKNPSDAHLWELNTGYLHDVLTVVLYRL